MPLDPSVLISSDPNEVWLIEWDREGEWKPVNWWHDPPMLLDLETCIEEVSKWQDRYKLTIRIRNVVTGEIIPAVLFNGD